MANVMTASKEQVDWAIGILDKAGEGGEIDPNDFFKASAVLTVVSYAAFDLAKEVERLQVEAERLKREVDEAERQSLDHYVGREELRDEVKRLKAKVNRLVDQLDSEGVYQAEDRSDYLADREELVAR